MDTVIITLKKTAEICIICVHLCSILLAKNCKCRIKSRQKNHAACIPRDNSFQLSERLAETQISLLNLYSAPRLAADLRPTGTGDSRLI